MKKKILLIALPMMAAIGLMSFTNNESQGSNQTITVPASLQKQVLNMAVENHLLSNSDAQAIKETDCIQRAVNAFINNGYDPAAAIDEVAKAAVEAGKYSNTAEAKRAIKKEIEKARNNNSYWNSFYKMCGL